MWKDESGLTGALAEDWSYDRETTTYTFALREGLTWHDGRKLTSDDVAFTFQYVREHPWPWVKSDVVQETLARDEHTVTIRLNRPYAPFLSNIAGTLPILPEHVWGKVENPGAFRAEGALVGSGPYRLEDYDPAHGSDLYAARAEYCRGKPRIERIQFVKCSEEMTPAALRAGKVNASAVPPDIVEDLKGAGLSVIGQPPVWAAKLMINHREEPLSNKKLRHAQTPALRTVDRRLLAGSAHTLQLSSP